MFKRFRTFGASVILSAALSAAPSSTHAATPVVTDVSAGGYHTCALKSDKTIWCWGKGDYGQLGNGSKSESYVPVKALTDAIFLSAGGDHTCAVKTAGTVWCWGRGSSGQLGANDTNDRPTPVKVVNLSAVARVSTGGGHTCAVKKDATVWCWGANFYGQLGDGSGNPGKQSSFPVKAKNLDAVRDVRTGAAHTCAIKVNGSVWCWGSNSYGKLGIPRSDHTSLPTRVSGFVAAAANISLGSSGLIGQPVGNAFNGYHTCAVLVNTTTWCWGQNEYGQLGIGEDRNDKRSPVKLAGFLAVSVGTGAFYSCARKANRSVWCWGLGDSGQLGDGAGKSKRLPTQVVGITNAVSISVGGYHACALTGGGARVWCWGHNEYGQLGVWNQGIFRQTSNVPVLVEFK